MKRERERERERGGGMVGGSDLVFVLVCVFARPGGPPFGVFGGGSEGSFDRRQPRASAFLSHGQAGIYAVTQRWRPKGREQTGMELWEGHNFHPFQLPRLNGRFVRIKSCGVPASFGVYEDDISSSRTNYRLTQSTDTPLHPITVDIRAHKGESLGASSEF